MKAMGFLVLGLVTVAACDNANKYEGASGLAEAQVQTNTSTATATDAQTSDRDQTLNEFKAQILNYLSKSEKFVGSYAAKIQSGELTAAQLVLRSVDELPLEFDHSKCDNYSADGELLPLCADGAEVYLDASLLNSNDERWNPRIHRVHVPTRIHTSQTVNLCGKGFAVSLLAYAACNSAIATVAACETVVGCAPAIAFASGVCGVAVDVIREAALQCIRAE